jgi:hypothetical protein
MLEEGGVVLSVVDFLHDFGDIPRRQKLPGEDSLQGAHEGEELVIAHLLVKHRQKVRSLVIDQIRPIDEGRARVVGDADAVGQRDRSSLCGVVGIGPP